MKGMTQVIRMAARFSIVPIEAERYRIAFHVILFLLYYPSPYPSPKPARIPLRAGIIFPTKSKILREPFFISLPRVK